MTVAAIGAVSGAGGIASIGGINPIGAGQSASGTSASGQSFGKAMSDGLQSVQNLNDNADQLATQAATGDLSDVSAYTVAATQANLATSLAVAVQSKAIDSFNQIMGMQV
jgi:flagellar hook-basal body complex protein FliE